MADVKNEFVCKYCGSAIPQDIIARRAAHGGRMPEFCNRLCALKFRRHGRMSKSEYEASLVRKCGWCGKEFKPMTARGRFCSDACILAANRHKGMSKAEAGAVRARKRKGEAAAKRMRENEEVESREEVSEFEYALALDASDRFAVVSTWDDEKKKRFRSHYCSAYGVRSSITSFERSVDDAEDADEDLIRIADSAARANGPVIVDEDNRGYE